ncbi:MAG: Crp/Fnr family transcriptional regulator [Muribaculaceae bacterium]|nr:Crp/Fnr family transcriptional regulator [Muribaculaceae bacterium]
MAQFNFFEDRIDFSFWREICMEHGELCTYRRGEYFARAGEVLKQSGWIVSGGFKHSITDSSGMVKAVGFVFADSPLSNYHSVILGKAMPVDIIALENSDVWEVKTHHLRHALDRNPDLQLGLIRAMFEQCYDTLLGTYRSSKEERYQQLLNRCPRIFELVSATDIATYLNISRRQLYRIINTQAKLPWAARADNVK